MNGPAEYRGHLQIWTEISTHRDLWPFTHTHRTTGQRKESRCRVLTVKQNNVVSALIHKKEKIGYLWFLFLERLIQKTSDPALKMTENGEL